MFLVFIVFFSFVRFILLDQSAISLFNYELVVAFRPQVRVANETTHIRTAALELSGSATAREAGGGGRCRAGMATSARD